MGRPLTQTQKDTVQAMLLRDIAQKDIAEAANCSIRQVKRIKKNILKWSSVDAPKFKANGRPRILTQSAIDVRLFTLDLEVFANACFLAS